MKYGLIAVLAALFFVAPVHAKTTSATSHARVSHVANTTKARTPLPPGTHFVKRTCKTDSCRQKHPGGTYMLPIKPKKSKAG